MKMITYAMLALGLMAALPVEANAVVCARGRSSGWLRRSAWRSRRASMAMVTTAAQRSSGAATAITAGSRVYR